MASSMAYIRAGQLRPLAVTTAKRSEALPELPTVGDFVPGYEASTAGGIGAPKGTPAEIVHKLNTEINAGLAWPTATVSRTIFPHPTALQLSPRCAMAQQTAMGYADRERIGGHVHAVGTGRYRIHRVGLGERNGRRDRQGRSHSSHDGAVHDHGQASRSRCTVLHATAWRDG